MKMAVLQDKLL